MSHRTGSKKEKPEVAFYVQNTARCARGASQREIMLEFSEESLYLPSSWSEAHPRFSTNRLPCPTPPPPMERLRIQNTPSVNESSPAETAIRQLVEVKDRTSP